eukprot:CAMPEP_0194263182 /NCGR_PEP_ID=MMETSP0158-20130606/46929_1 /TAXON_ID=33649 /ORGANISM="Thalassionema nitzschioides, Strain L26-B" /LENGTH=608 /DNA_ID=CAMNT_0039003361 /DNA_START=251 /DNA_END=2073 /DNA_ORIENTATION=-
MNTSPVSIEDTYHSDLVRILSKESNLPKNPMQRTAKPFVLQGDVDGVEKSIRMLRHMMKVGVATEKSFQLVFEAVLKKRTNAVANCANSRSEIRYAERAEELLERIESGITSDVYGGKTCAANELETLLMEMEEFFQGSVSLEIYNIVLDAYANCANSRSEIRYAERAEELLERIESDACSVYHVLRAWAWQQGNRDVSQCAYKANDYLQLLEENPPEPVILAKAYDVVLEAYSKAIGGATSADTIFSLRTRIDIPIPMDDHTNIILAWTKDERDGSAAKATEYIEKLSEMYLTGEITEDPEHIAFAAVISAWRRANKPEKAEKVLWLMEKKVRPKAKSLKPTVFTYNNVCFAYVADSETITTKSFDAISNIVTYMENNCKEQPLIKPDSYTYNALITACTLSGNLRSIEQIEILLDRMEAMLQGGNVTNKNFNVVMNAYAKSKDPEAASKVLGLLKRMKESNFVKPDTITYTTVIECLTKSANADFAAETALKLLAELDKIYQTTRKEDMMPNARTFAMTILALTKASRKDKVQLARRLLDQQIKVYESNRQAPALRPTVHPYNYIINCAANSEHDRIETFKLAAKTYQDLRDHPDLKPDSYTYCFW